MKISAIFYTHMVNFHRPGYKVTGFVKGVLIGCSWRTLITSPVRFKSNLLTDITACFNFLHNPPTHSPH